MQETWVRSLGREDSPGEGKGYPVQYSGLENSIDCIVPGVTKSLDTTERLSLRVFRERMLCWHLDLGFWPPKLWKEIFLTFYAKKKIISYLHTERRTHLRIVGASREHHIQDTVSTENCRTNQMLESGWNEKKKASLKLEFTNQRRRKAEALVSGFSLRQPGGWANNWLNGNTKNKLWLDTWCVKGPQHAQVGTGSRLLKITQSSVEGGPSWSAVGRCCHTRKENSRRTPCTLPTLKRRLDAIRKKDSATVYTVEKKRPWSSWDLEAVITFLKGSPEENQDCHAVSTSLQTSLPITYADMSSGVHNFLKSSPNGVPLQNSHQFSLIWQFVHWPSNFLKPTFKTIVTSYSFDRSVSHKNVLTEGTKKSDTSSKTTLFKLFSQLTLICFSLLIPPTTTTTPFVFVLFEAIFFKHLKE